MSISTAQSKALKEAINTGLSTLYRQPPLTGTDWANSHFYLSSESSYQEGRWETLPFQVALLNMICNDEIRIVNIIKSARVGYSKMLIAAGGYQLEHKRRNILFLVPTDQSSKEFMKDQIQTMIRDVPSVRKLAPWFGKKHPDNTLDKKRFSHGKQLWCRGGASANNYRALSTDTVIYDELASFDHDIEGEGSPTFLGDKRIEGSAFPKSVRGSTPSENKSETERCQIHAAADESPHLFKLNVPCPHCQKEQSLKWGGKDCSFGIKWDPDNPLGAWYLCEHSGCVVQQHEMYEMQPQGRWICEKTGIWTRDGYDFYDSADMPVPTPRNITAHIWSAYSPFAPWGGIAEDFLKIKGDRSRLKTFTNTTLGEVWEEDVGERLEWQRLYARREVYPELPDEGLVLMGGIDTQDDRYEGRVWAFGKGEEAWLVDRWVLMGDPASEELRRKVRERIRKQYTRTNGEKVGVIRWCWDSGGHYTDEVYAESRALGVMWVIPVKGESNYGRPIATMPNKRKKGSRVYLTMVGTDNAKELIYNRLKQDYEPGQSQPGFLHLPANSDICDEDELKQLTAEEKQVQIVKGKRVYRWTAKGRRNEALDCLVYAIAALRISQQRFGLNLDEIEAPQPAQQLSPPAPQEQSQPAAGGWLNLGEGTWLT